MRRTEKSCLTKVFVFAQHSLETVIAVRFLLFCTPSVRGGNIYMTHFHVGNIFQSGETIYEK